MKRSMREGVAERIEFDPCGLGEGGMATVFLAEDLRGEKSPCTLE